MAGYIRQFRDSYNNSIYPVTSAKGVYINSTDTVERMLNDLEESNTDIVFGDGSITTTKASGSVITTLFGEGVIRETTVNSSGKTVRVKTTTIKNDGSIEIRVVGYEDGIQ